MIVLDILRIILGLLSLGMVGMGIFMLRQRCTGLGMVWFGLAALSMIGAVS